MVSERARGTADSALSQDRPPRTTELEVELDTPLPDSLPVGRGTALFLKGRCTSPSGWRVGRLSIEVDGDEHPVMAHGISDRRVVGEGDMWWGIVPFGPAREARRSQLLLRGVLEGGDHAHATLGTVRVEPNVSEFSVSVSGTPGSANRPLVGICMATYEPPLDLFREQIDSIRAQTYENWSCVISDDRSRPERLAEMRAILGDDPRFVLSPSSERRGFYGNFQRALAQRPAESEYVALADQDDRWHPEKLEVLVEALDSGATLAYSDARVIDEDGGVRSETYWRYRRNNYTDFTSLLITNAITGAAALFRRELAERALPFPPPQGDIFHDHWIALVAMATGEIRYVDRPLYDYVQHSGAAIGFTNANAGRGRWGGRLGDMALRLLRLGWRIVRPVGQIRYFDNYCRLALEARTLEVRFGESMTPRQRGALRRIRSCDGSLRGLAWLAYRSLRPLAGRNETMGMERGLLAGILWRRLAGLRASLGRTSLWT